MHVNIISGCSALLWSQYVYALLCVKYIGMNMKSKIVVKLYGVINLTLSCS